MKTKDIKIISHLRTDSRMPLTKMSKKTSIPVSTLFDKLKPYENDLILKHTSLLNFAELGFNARANILLQVAKEDKENLKNYLSSHHTVNSLYRINNGFDFMVEGIFKQLKEVEEFFDDMDSKFSITDKKSFFIIEDLKREVFMSNPDIDTLNNF